MSVSNMKNLEKQLQRRRRPSLSWKPSAHPGSDPRTLRRNGLSLPVISENFGHSSFQTIIFACVVVVYGSVMAPT